MGRKEKILYKSLSIENKEIIDVREIGYYSTPDFVAKYIAKRILQINCGGKLLLDPCCGKEELIKYFDEYDINIIGMDLIKYKKYYNCDFHNYDFIKYYCENKYKEEWNYDYYIANPPYNCHEVDFIKSNKQYLKEFFHEVGVHNMYSMFIYAIIDKAKDGAVIGLITHDSFFSAKNHMKLRKKILEDCSIEEITMCPIELFHNQGADVRTSIVILRKGKRHQKKVRVNNRVNSLEEFKVVLSRNSKSNFTGKMYDLDEIVLNNKKDNLEFLIECPEDIRRLFNKNRLGERFKCITGISTGNDRLYLSKIKDENYLVPFYKNPGKDKFYTKRIIYLHKDFLELSNKVKSFNVRNKKFLYKPGITCSSIGVNFNACILPKGSTYGVNPNIICESEDVWWLVSYLNSSLVTYIVRGALIRSNMITSGYVARIPLLSFDEEEKELLKALGKRAYELRKNDKSIVNELKYINDIVNKAAKISKESEKIIDNFKRNLIKST